MGPQALFWLPRLLVAVVAVAGIAAVIVWASARVARGDLQNLEAVNAVMEATVLRHGRRQTLGALLDCAARHLGAVSGSVHLAVDLTGLQLVHTVGVQRMDLLVRLPGNDELALRAGAGPVVDTVGLYTPWAALSDGEPYAVCALGLRGPDVRGLLVLCWPKQSAAENSVPVLRQIGRYADQVLAEYASLEQRARDVQALNDELLWQDRLTRTTAHDMKNQLCQPCDVLGRLKDEADGFIRPQVRQAWQDLELAMNMLSEFAHPDRPITPVPVEIEELANVAAAMMQQQCQFTVETTPEVTHVWGERLSILRVLDNLLRNAVRYNRPNSALRVWLVVSLLEDDMVQFEVGDDGIGMTAETQAQLFGFGYRAEATAGVEDGMGIGLWSCQRLVEAMGGQIGVASAPGQGARFYFTLPAV